VEPHSLRFKASVEKDLRRIPAATRLHTYRLRVGTCRVVYQVDDSEQSVTVEYVRHRRDAYRCQGNVTLVRYRHRCVYFVYG
jgi:mRNA-degrading endonuclease RelE of RelBE toxin-antitoxin system